MSLVYQNKHY